MAVSTDDEGPKYDVSNPEHVRDKAKLAKAREERRLNGLRQIMASADGRLFMWDFLSRCGLFAVNFSGHANRDAFDSGMRNAAMPIFADIQRSLMPEYLTMVKEANEVNHHV